MPAAPAPPTPAASPPSGTLGVLSIVLGAVVALSEVVDLVRVELTRDRATTDLLGGVGVEVQAAAPYVGLRAAVMLLMSLALVVVGVGLKWQWRRARVAAIVWSEVALAALVGRAVLWQVCIGPHVDRARLIAGDSIAATGIPILGDLTSSFLELAHFFEYAILVVLLVYPVALLVILSRRRRRDLARGA